LSIADIFFTFSGNFINKREGTLLVLEHSPHCAFAIRRKYVSPAPGLLRPSLKMWIPTPVGGTKQSQGRLEKMLAVIMG